MPRAVAKDMLIHRILLPGFIFHSIFSFVQYSTFCQARLWGTSKLCVARRPKKIQVYRCGKLNLFSTFTTVRIKAFKFLPGAENIRNGPAGIDHMEYFQRFNSCVLLYRYLLILTLYLLSRK